jgi:hypothetical protein
LLHYYSPGFASLLRIGSTKQYWPVKTKDVMLQSEILFACEHGRRTQHVKQRGIYRLQSSWGWMETKDTKLGRTGMSPWSHELGKLHIGWR